MILISHLIWSLKKTTTPKTEEHYSNLPEPVPDYEDPSSHQPLRSPGWKKLPYSNGAGASDDASEDFPPPPPPITADDLAAAVSDAYEAQVNNGISPTAPESEESGVPPQIKPKPLHNPCLESRERQALHRELITNYKL